MKMNLPLLIFSLFFLVACSSSDDASNVQPAQEPSATNDVSPELEELEVEETDTNDMVPQVEETNTEAEFISIPMSDSNENGRYFLTSHTTEDGIENVEYIRRGNENDAYGKMQIKCSNNEMRKNSTDSPESLVAMDLGDWYTPTPDWTDKDIFNFICNN